MSSGRGWAARAERRILNVREKSMPGPLLVGGQVKSSRGAQSEAVLRSMHGRRPLDASAAVGPSIPKLKCRFFKSECPIHPLIGN